MSKRDPLFPFFILLKDRIESDTVGAEITDGLAEICYNILIYWVEYSLTREFNTAFHDFDTEPDNRSQTFVSIHDYAVWDQAGEAVSCSFDPHALESMFSQPDFDY
jgi:hypothetical protein